MPFLTKGLPLTNGHGRIRVRIPSGYPPVSCLNWNINSSWIYSWIPISRLVGVALANSAYHTQPHHGRGERVLPSIFQASRSQAKESCTCPLEIWQMPGYASIKTPTICLWVQLIHNWKHALVAPSWHISPINSQFCSNCGMQGSAYAHDTRAYLTSTVSATLASLLLLNTAQLPQAAITHWVENRHQHMWPVFLAKWKSRSKLTPRCRMPHLKCRQATSKFRPATSSKLALCKWMPLLCNAEISNNIIRQLNEISNTKMPSCSLLRLQKTASHMDSRFADHPHTQLAAPLKHLPYDSLVHFSLQL